LRKTISILLLLILSSATYFIGASYYWKVKQLKRAIKKSLAEGNIDYEKVVAFNKSEIADAVWIEPREFRLNEKMYDIYKTDTLENDLVYHCFLDDKEGAWVELLLAFSNSSQPVNKTKDFSPLKFLLKDIIIESAQCSVLSVQVEEIIFIPCSHLTNQPFIHSIYSPPEFVS
jgi:hypothetical protein